MSIRFQAVVRILLELEDSMLRDGATTLGRVMNVGTRVVLTVLLSVVIAACSDDSALDASGGAGANGGADGTGGFGSGATGGGGSGTGAFPPCVMDAQPHGLPAPTEVGRTTYLFALAEFLEAFEYRALGWCEDKGKVRDTGPYVNGVGYEGTHPPVHMFYSPKAMDWLLAGRQGPMPTGALIVKEQFYGVEVNGELRSMMPAIAYQELTRDELDLLFTKDQAGWTTMFKDPAGSHDGWFWAEHFASFTVDEPTSATTFSTNFGSPCDRCHASAETEHTFISTENIAGFPGEPETYTIEDGWETQPAAAPADSEYYKTSREFQAYPLAFGQWEPDTKLNSAWLTQYSSISEVSAADVVAFPSANLDHVPHPPFPQYFVSADQCLGCHGALQSQPSEVHGGHGTMEADAIRSPMFLPNGEDMGTDISPYGDWRFTPMGLAGRDPIFYAQLETEIAKVEYEGHSAVEVAAFSEGLTKTCMSCHGGPGVRQAQLDNVEFKKDFIYLDDPSDDNFKYGALARDGINCTMCHHIAEAGSESDFFASQTTGAFPMSPVNVIYGPYKTETLHPKPMEHGVGFTPKYADHMSDSSTSSRLCGHCHTINLPAIDAPHSAATPPSEAFPIAANDPNYGFNIHPEQATYTEWLNSEFQTVFGGGSGNAQSCQDCHMQKTYQNTIISTIIAAIEDSTYPAVPYMLPGLDLFAREDYGRHQFVGLNVPLLMMFSQFDDVLGVPKTNYMSGLPTGLANNIAMMLEQAANKTVTLTVDTSLEDADATIVASVELQNLTGHRFPSGVAFRRAWLEVLLVNHETQQTLWGSGRTNSVGVIVDGSGAQLPTELFTAPPPGFDKPWQPHYEQIDFEDKVQIYEEIALNADGLVTYSFLRRNDDPKDNRLLPRGWTAEGPSPSLAAIIQSTHPPGSASADPNYLDGSGTDTFEYRIPAPDGVSKDDLEVRVTVYYQATSPAFLHEKFVWSADGPATKRLYYLMSNLNTEGTPFENWKLPVKSATVAVN